MNPPLQPGLRHVQTLRVDQSLTVPAVSQAFAGFADMPPVFTTAFLVGFIEWACIELLRPHLAPGQQSVGTHVDISHVAATPVGMMVSAEVELLQVRGRVLRFRVACRDELELIGEGLHERTLVDGARFAARARNKRAATPRA